MEEENLFYGLKAEIHHQPIEWENYQNKNIMSNEEIQPYFKKLEIELDFSFFKRNKRHFDIADHTIRNCQQNISIIDISQPK